MWWMGGRCGRGCRWSGGGGRGGGVGPFNSVSYHVPPDQPTLSAGAARPSTGSKDDSLSHRPSSRRGAGLPTPTRAPYLTGDTRVGINSGVPWLGSHALSCACAGSMRAYAVCVRFHQVGATRGYYSRVGQPPQVASGASPPFIPSCLLSLLHPYKGGDMGGRRACCRAGLFTRTER